MANYQQAQIAKHANLPLSPSLKAWLSAHASTPEQKKRQEKITRVPYRVNTIPKLPYMRVNWFEASNVPSLLKAMKPLYSGLGLSLTRVESAQKLQVLPRHPLTLELVACRDV